MLSKAPSLDMSSVEFCTGREFWFPTVMVRPRFSFVVVRRMPTFWRPKGALSTSLANVQGAGPSADARSRPKDRALNLRELSFLSVSRCA